MARALLQCGGVPGSLLQITRAWSSPRSFPVLYRVAEGRPLVQFHLRGASRPILSVPGLGRRSAAKLFEVLGESVRIVSPWATEQTMVAFRFRNGQRRRRLGRLITRPRFSGFLRKVTPWRFAAPASAESRFLIGPVLAKLRFVSISRRIAGETRGHGVPRACQAFWPP